MKAHKEYIKFSELDNTQLSFLNQISEENRLVFNHALAIAQEDSNFSKIASLYQDIRTKDFILPSKVAQNTCRTLIQAIKNFFKKVKTDKTARYPKRFKKFGIFTTMTYDINGGIKEDNYNQPFMIRDGKLVFSYGAGKNRKFIYFSLSDYALSVLRNDNIRILTISKDEVLDSICFSFSYKEDKKEKELNNEFIAIDLGCSQIATIYSSDNNHFSIENSSFKNLEKQINNLKSKIDVKFVRGSNQKKHSKKIKKLKKTLRHKQRKLSNKNKDFQHKTSRKIINHCIDNNIDNIIVGNIQTKKLAKNCKAKKLNASTQNRGTLSRFKEFLNYKATDASLGFSLVNEAYTSQTNCLTDEIELSSKLDIRQHELDKDFVVDRDLNAACNIAKRNKALWSSHTLNISSLKSLKKMYIDTNSVMYEKKLVSLNNF